MRWRLLGYALLVSAAACSDTGSDAASSGGSLGAGFHDASVGAVQPGALGGVATGTTGGGLLAGGGLPGAGAVPGGGLVGGVGGTAGGAPALGDGLPCDVSAVLKQRCQTCHGNPLMSGPMPLITWADLQAASTLQPGMKIAARVKARINSPTSPMPPAGRPALTAQEKQTLNAYLDGGALQNSFACSGSGGATAGGATAGGGAQAGGTTGGGAVGPASCDYELELRAHGGQGRNDNTPFEPPQGSDHYEMFYFTAPWTEKVQTIQVTPIVDNGAVLHHWLLYMEDGDGSGDGSHQADIGLQSLTAQLLSGWAPGNDSLPLASDVGLQTVSGPNARFGIEIHYNTTANPPNRKDRSGARICVTKKLRPKEAAVHWLGTQLIASLGLGGTVDIDGTCSVQQQSHIIAMSPHMHKKGRYMKTIVQRASGGTETITDQPFQFDDQQVFPVKSPSGEIMVGPGDVINTTCTYDGSEAFTFGPNTNDEMCYNFVVAWPVGSLSNGVPGLVGGNNTCIDGL